ncbi:hypothetical protein NM208_g10302 [Fusarium decemcellulare]|uniref:Uncharacterized protein n=1 Tax=Fusarium decemcellulare TaxID=57161 RepID=A0ACC1RYB4_9HYPO|nr:hypothetical protein NM208_g10302 [Fusarium decemcellulare]
MDGSAGVERRDIQLDFEALGRRRPAVFASRWSEIGFCSALLGSMLMAEYLVSGFHVVLPQLSADLDIPQASQTWPSSVFSLVTGSMLLPVGRLGDMYGGYVVFNAGLLWAIVWSLIAGFSQNYLMLIFCRALQGLGSAAFLPAGIMMLGKLYRPGPRKNLVFSLYGAFAPMGFFVGILMGGISAQLLTWRWFFWLGTILLVAIAVVALLAVPFDYPNKQSNVQMDWLGAGSIVPGLVLVIYSITDSSHASDGWTSPNILATLVAGIGFLGIAYYIETRVATHPLLPTDLFSPKYMKRLIITLFMAYGVFGLFLFYSTFYIELVLNVSPLLTVVWYLPMITGGLVLATIGGFTLHLLSGRVLLVISGVSNLLCALLFAIMPEDPSYWAYVFPAMIFATIGIDVGYIVSNIFITSQIPARRQGIAGALINSLLFLGISFFLGIGDIVVGETSHLGLKRSYQSAFWLAVGLGGLSTVLYCFVDVGTAKSDLTVEERQQLESEAPRDQGDGSRFTISGYT